MRMPGPTELKRMIKQAMRDRAPKMYRRLGKAGRLEAELVDREKVAREAFEMTIGRQGSPYERALAMDGADHFKKMGRSRRHKAHQPKVRSRWRWNSSRGRPGSGTAQAETCGESSELWAEGRGGGRQASLAPEAGLRMRVIHYDGEDLDRGRSGGLTPRCTNCLRAEPSRAPPTLPEACVGRSPAAPTYSVTSLPERCQTRSAQD